MNSDKPPIEGEFREFILRKASDIPAREMCEDIDFCTRLLGDVFDSGKKKFNKSGTKSNCKVTPLDMLWKEFQECKEEEKMGLMICNKCGGSLVRIGSGTEMYFKCSNCGEKFDKPPAVGRIEKRGRESSYEKAVRLKKEGKKDD